jgi:hypothetical protein
LAFPKIPDRRNAVPLGLAALPGSRRKKLRLYSCRSPARIKLSRVDYIIPYDAAGRKGALRKNGILPLGDRLFLRKKPAFRPAFADSDQRKNYPNFHLCL